MRSLLAAVALAALLAIMVLADAVRVLGRPLALEQDERLLIAPGQPLRAVAEELGARGWLDAAPRSVWYLQAYARIRGLATRLKAGEYLLQPGMSAFAALDLFVAGRTVLYELRLVEGWTFRQALAAVRAHPQIRQVLPEADAATLMRALGRADQHPEGRLFPDTYRFGRETTEVEFLRRAADMMDRVLAREWDARAPELPYASADEALVMASIVEKETGAPKERAEIAGVFVRRLRLGMRLQTDPTVIYGLGEAFDGDLRLRDLRTDGDYNTYTRSGLPPTPICLPGRAAIRAALHPADGKTLFFVSRGDGSHVFSETLAEHEAAVREYQLRRARESR